MHDIPPVGNRGSPAGTKEARASFTDAAMLTDRSVSHRSTESSYADTSVAMAIQHRDGGVRHAARRPVTPTPANKAERVYANHAPPGPATGLSAPHAP